MSDRTTDQTLTPLEKTVIAEALMARASAFRRAAGKAEREGYPSRAQELMTHSQTCISLMEKMGVGPFPTSLQHKTTTITIAPTS